MILEKALKNGIHIDIFNSNLTLQHFKNLLNLYLYIIYLTLRILIPNNRNIITYLHYSIICVCAYDICFKIVSISLLTIKPLNED